MNRETIAVALFGKVSNAGSYVTKARVLKHWSDMAPSEFPAVFLCMGPNTNKDPKRGLAPKWELDYQAWIYVMAKDPADVPSTLLNAALDALEAALTPDVATGVQDLGLPDSASGTCVSHCWLSGTIETDEGTLGQIAVAKVPISLLAY